MFRHPRYEDMPWDIQWRHDAGMRHHWWLIALLILTALLVIGVRATGGMA